LIRMPGKGSRFPGLQRGEHMAVLRKSDIEKMNAKELQTKITEIERSLLELEGEGKHEKKKPLKKAIAKLLTRIRMTEKGLNTGSVPKNTVQKVN